MDSKVDAARWARVRDLLRASGLRWTPQRRAVVDVLSRSHGHVVAAQLVDQCRAIDPTTTPSTVYRTLDVLERLGLVRHGHGADGREEYHVLPEQDHGHLHCDSCGSVWELEAAEAAAITRRLRTGRGFEVDLSHITIVGRCADCRARAEASPI
jgi:Fur family ferric uptake transcriptional regulator